MCVLIGIDTVRRRDTRMDVTISKIEKLNSIERSIAEMLSNIAESVREMSKDNPSLEVVEEKTKQFLSALEKIDYSLSEEIAYLSEVSTTHPHVGSIYGEEKDYELTCQQVILAKEKLNKLLISLSSKQSQLNNRDSRTMSFVSS
ncbi:mediator of RNA polymerase II transcription subunit 11-like [Dysidea avara]|uniref:mediator of RNA polymerase II transcription subunit 11-like n=1 Tax=Dysidea avara TaxID=196820 RepID=UPI00331A1E5D